MYQQKSILETVDLKTNIYVYDQFENVQNEKTSYSNIVHYFPAEHNEKLMKKAKPTVKRIYLFTYIPQLKKVNLLGYYF